MPGTLEYRVYIIGEDGHIKQRVELVCSDDESARTQAAQLVDGHDVELWQGTRKIARFPARS